MNKLKELYETDRKKYWAYVSCIIIAVFTVIFCIAILIGSSDTLTCDHEYVIIEEIAPTYTEEGKQVKECSLCGSTTTKTLPKLTAPSYIEGVEYDEIYTAFQENELRAKDTYQYNRYRITAEVVDIESGGLFNLSGADLTLVIKVGNTYVFIEAEFGEDQLEALKTINVGDTITFAGKCIDDQSWTECELIK